MDGYDLDDPRPAYLRVADELRDQIRTGDLASGDQLPTHSALATKYGVAVETIKRALGLVRAEGLIVTRQGKGSFVRQGPNEVEDFLDTAELGMRLLELAREISELNRRLSIVEGQISG